MDNSGATATAFNDSSWASVTLPHTWNATDGQDGGSNYYRGIGWYRRHYTPPASAAGKRIFLQFDGANIVAIVYVNGTMVGTHRGGFARFRFDVTGDDDAGQRQRHRRAWSRTPRSATSRRWTPTSPSSAACTATCTCWSPIRFTSTRWTSASSGVYVSASSVSATSATLSDGRARPQRSDADADGRPSTRWSCARTERSRRACPASGQRRGGRVAAAGRTAAFPNPHLWNGVADPYLYTVYAEVRVGGRRHRRRVGAVRLSLLFRRRRAGLLAERPVPGPARREPPPGSAEHGLGDHRRAARRGHGADPRAGRQRRPPVALRARRALPRSGRSRRASCCGPRSRWSTTSPTPPRSRTTPASS